MADDILQQLLAATDPAHKAALVANFALSHEEPVLAELVPVLAFLRWFDESVVAALLPESDRARSAKLYARLIELPFVERVTYGYALHDLTRRGLLLTSTSASRFHASTVAEIYGQSLGFERLLEHFYCLALGGQDKKVQRLFDEHFGEFNKLSGENRITVLRLTLEEANSLVTTSTATNMGSQDVSSGSTNFLEEITHIPSQQSQPKRTSDHEAIILWASYFDELAAVSFSHEFRNMGIRVRTLAIDKDEKQERSLPLTHSLQGLEDIIISAANISCLVIPSSIEALGQFRQNALFWQLVDTAYSNGSKIVLGRSHGSYRNLDPEVSQKLPPLSAFIFYPEPERLLIFARRLASIVLRGDELDSTRIEATSPPLIRVANDSNPSTVAGAIASIVREFGFAETQAVGAAAGNQMYKAAAIAKAFLSYDNLSIYTVPDFTTVNIQGNPRSALRLFISAWPQSMDSIISLEHVRSSSAHDRD